MDYGSQANYNPLSVIVNGSFDILQISNRNNRLASLQISNGFRNVWWNLTHAGRAVSQYGFRRFINTEIIPTSFRLRNAQHWPNYQLHLIGGGITYVAMSEWFELHAFRSPRIWSASTMIFYHFLNEAIENGGYNGPNVDPIADLLVFDPVGIALFSISGVPEFFAGTLHAVDWSFQPFVSVARGTLLNNGQNFAFKWDMPWFPEWRLFYITGMEGGLGVSRRVNATDDISVSGGVGTRELIEADIGTGVRTLTATLVWTAGFFYDRNGSLLSSVILGGGRGYMARINVYPGLFALPGLQVGGSLLIYRDGLVSAGINVAGLPSGLGF
jgi:hypothetical protein